MKRWSVMIRGTESGQLHELQFMRFWTRKGAHRWVADVERTHPSELTEWVVARVHRKETKQP